MKEILETRRLYLRELEPADKDDLAAVLSDPESMQFYPAPFTEEQVEDWISWNIGSYRELNHGLWAVILKKGKRFLGDCGITLQEIDGVMLPELGYHIRREYCGHGYASEAARACMDYGFYQLGYDSLYSYMKEDNHPSIRVAEKNGMDFVRNFEKEVAGMTVTESLYRIHRP